MLKLALRNILRQKTRTAMTLAAIVVSVVGLILSSGFVEDIFKSLGEAVIRSQSGHLQLGRTGYFTHGARKPEQYLIAGHEPVRRAIASLPEVDDVMARLSFSGLLNNGRTDHAIVGEGIEPEREARLGSAIRILSGRQLSSTDRFGILLGEGVAQALGLSSGSRATLLLNTADGAMNALDFEVVGVFRSMAKDYDDRAVRIPLAAAQELLATRGVNVVVVSLRETDATTRAASALAALVEGRGLEVKRWEELNDFYAKTVDLYERQLGVLRLIVLVMVLLSVTNTVNMTVHERIGEVGTMRAIGNRSRDVFRLIVLECLILGVLGAGLGAMLGAGLAQLISAIGIPMPPPPNANSGYLAQIRLTGWTVAGAFAVGLLATIVASLVPARRVTRIDIVDALRQNV